MQVSLLVSCSYTPKIGPEDVIAHASSSFLAPGASLPCRASQTALTLLVAFNRSDEAA